MLFGKVHGIYYNIISLVLFVKFNKFISHFFGLVRDEAGNVSDSEQPVSGVPQLCPISSAVNNYLPSITSPRAPAQPRLPFYIASFARSRNQPALFTPSTQNFSRRSERRGNQSLSVGLFERSSQAPVRGIFSPIGRRICSQ